MDETPPPIGFIRLFMHGARRMLVACTKYFRPQEVEVLDTSCASFAWYRLLQFLKSSITIRRRNHCKQEPVKECYL